MTTEIKRIVPEEVVGIFEKLNLKPTEAAYFDDKKTCACAVGAIALDADINIGTMSSFSTMLRLGYSDNYISGIIEGFDGIKGESTDSIKDRLSEFRLGYDDGQKVRNLLLDKGYEMLYMGREKE